MNLISYGDINLDSEGGFIMKTNLSFDEFCKNQGSLCHECDWYDVGDSIDDCRDKFNNEVKMEIAEIKFPQLVENIYQSISDSFNINGMLLNEVEVVQFKDAIKKGIDKHD